MSCKCIASSPDCSDNSCCTYAPVAADDAQKTLSTSSPASTVSTAVPKKVSPSKPSSTSALSDIEVTQLQQELAVLKEQPRAQMVCTATISAHALLSHKWSAQQQSDQMQSVASGRSICQHAHHIILHQHTQ